MDHLLLNIDCNMISLLPKNSKSNQVPYLQNPIIVITYVEKAAEMHFTYDGLFTDSIRLDKRTTWVQNALYKTPSICSTIVSFVISCVWIFGFPFCSLCRF